MEFDILGPIAVQLDGQLVQLGAVAALLALLILEANRPVSQEHLVGAIGKRPSTRSAGSTVHSQIAQLRKILGPGRLPRVAGGYQLRVADGELDAAKFESELRRAEVAMAGGDPAAAAADLERGLARWRGTALQDVGVAEWAATEADRLNGLHLVAEEALFDVRLSLRQHDEVIEMAEAAIRLDPGREAIWACLMLALYRAGRRPDAVRAYQRLHRMLEADGGRAPSAELVKLERAILHDDPSLAAAQRPKVLTPAPVRAGSASERALPGGVVTFLMTDVVGSTRLWETAPGAMRDALARHDELMKLAVDSHDGVLLRERGEGDSTFSVFGRATDAAAAALAAQLSLEHEPWLSGCVIRCRVAIHTGEASERDGDYYGRPVNRVARLRAIAEGGQILVSQSAAEILMDHLPAEAMLMSLGVKELHDFDRPETVYLLGSSKHGVLVNADGPRTSEMSAVAADQMPAMSAVALHPQRAPTRATWEAVVEADVTFYELSGDKDVPFPARTDVRAITLTEKVVIIGRRRSSGDSEPGIDLSGAFEDPGVSRLHAVLERQDDGSYTLTDSGSTNGTFLNDMRQAIPRGVPVTLAPGDSIYLGAWTAIHIQAT